MVELRRHKLVSLPATEPRTKTAARAEETALQPDRFVHSEFCIYLCVLKTPTKGPPLFAMNLSPHDRGITQRPLLQSWLAH